MTEEAYNKYVTTCKEMGFKPSPRESLVKDGEKPHQLETPIHIRKPFDHTGKRKSFQQHMDDLCGERSYLITKAQLLEFAEMVLEDARQEPKARS